MRIFSLRSFWFALPAGDVETIADWRQPTPLPNAPSCVLGVVSIEARMITVLNPSLLVNGGDTSSANPSLIVTLAGDEQLGLIADLDHGPGPEELNEAGRLIPAITHNGEVVQILNPHKLFTKAMQGNERRRRRSQI